MTTRSVAVLLTMDTYQGMSDGEIDSIIEYKVKRALKNAGLADALERATARMNDMGEAARARIMESESKLKGE